MTLDIRFGKMFGERPKNLPKKYPNPPLDPDTGKPLEPSYPYAIWEQVGNVEWVLVMTQSDGEACYRNAIRMQEAGKTVWAGKLK